MPAEATSLAGTSVLNCVLLTKVVVERFVAFHSTFETEIKFDPSTLSVNPDPLCSLFLGDSVEMLGVGLGGGGGVPLAYNLVNLRRRLVAD